MGVTKIMYPMKIEHVDDCGNGWGWSIVSNGDDSFELALFNRGVMMDCNPVFKGDVYRADWIQINSVLDEIVLLPTWEKV